MYLSTANYQGGGKGKGQDEGTQDFVKLFFLPILATLYPAELKNPNVLCKPIMQYDIWFEFCHNSLNIISKLLAKK